MVKNKHDATLGKAIINAKEKFSKRRLDVASRRHDADDGLDGKTFTSVTDQTSLDDFLTTAELRGTEFAAERMTLDFGSANTQSKSEALTPISAPDQANGTLDLIRIPRRPTWNERTTPEELTQLENAAFLEWRRNIAEIENAGNTTVTPFERNIELWRQLWRVIERSHIVVQVLDARNPLLFRCTDLEKYVREVDANKINVLLLNKGDLLSYQQRSAWIQYFRDIGVYVAFFSSLEEFTHDPSELVEDIESAKLEHSCEEEGVEDIDEDDEWTDCSSTASSDVVALHADVQTTPRILSVEELLRFFRLLRPAAVDSQGGVLTIGMVGYPNVGKSSTINRLLGQKKVKVSATPGKTKHFQTLYIDEDLVLCDCPGLVMPSFATSNAELIASGILPIDQMRDSFPPIALVAQRIPRAVLQRTYGIMLPQPSEFEPANRSPSPNELLTSLAYVRGFMSPKGIPDCSRAARLVLKDFACGKLRYCHAPPGVDPLAFNHQWMSQANSDNAATMSSSTTMGPQVQLEIMRRRHLLDEKQSNTSMDRKFFAQSTGIAHVKSANSANIAAARDVDVTKPWKKHNNRNKKEKLRRVYRDLDA